MDDLLEILGSVAMDNYCSRYYWEWEDEIATPRLKDLGYSNIQWCMGEQDSFGPLARIVHCDKDGQHYRFVYS